jgi:hypothetical protein
MTEKRPAPKPEDDTYSDEEIAKRMDATVRAMIGMKPRPHKRHKAPLHTRVQKDRPQKKD